MTALLRPRGVQGIAFAALLALSLWFSAAEAVAVSRGDGIPNLFDQGPDDRPGRLLHRPVGRLGVTWE